MTAIVDYPAPQPSGPDSQTATGGHSSQSLNLLPSIPALGASSAAVGCSSELGWNGARMGVSTLAAGALSAPDSPTATRDHAPPPNLPPSLPAQGAPALAAGAPDAALSGPEALAAGRDPQNPPPPASPQGAPGPGAAGSLDVPMPDPLDPDVMLDDSGVAQAIANMSTADIDKLVAAFAAAGVDHFEEALTHTPMDLTPPPQACTPIPHGPTHAPPKTAQALAETPSSDDTPAAPALDAEHTDSAAPKTPAAPALDAEHTDSAAPKRASRKPRMPDADWVAKPPRPRSVRNKPTANKKGAPRRA